MKRYAAMLFRNAALAGALALAACGSGDDAELDRLDNQITGNEADPALTSALEDQIMIDPALTQQSNRNAVRPPETPTQALYPPSDGSPAARSASLDDTGDGGLGGCVGEFDYDKRWAERLPASFAVYPGARLTDAAASKTGDCRVVTFATSASPQDVLDWYRAKTNAAGFSSEQQKRGGDLVLGGINERNGGAFYLIVTPKGGGSEAALIANKGS